MVTEAPVSTSRRGLAFLAGASFAAVPTVGPYLALLAIVSGRLQLHRADRWWWFAALALSVPWIATGYVWNGVGTALQVLAVWLIFRAAAEVRRSVIGTALSVDVGAGLVAGLAGALALGIARSTEWRLESARSFLDVFAWTGNPALFGHAMVVLAVLLAVVVPSTALRSVALALGALAALVSGAHEAVLAWLLVAVGVRFMRRRGGRGTALAEWGLIAVMLFVASGLGEAVGLGRPGFRLDLVAPSAGTNLFRGTETVGEWWYPLGVRFDDVRVSVEGAERTGFTVTKTDRAPYARLQQIVELRPGRSYVLSVAWRAEAEGEVGLDGWGRSPDGGRDATLAATYRNGAWLTNATQHFTVTSAGLEPLGDGWLRGSVAFRLEGDARLVWYVGAVPDRSSSLGSSATFAEFLLVEGDALVPYVANTSDVRITDLRATRLPMWREAFQAIAQRPWLGWGPSGFQRATETLQPVEASFRPVAAHAHSLLIDTWVERGLVGLVGLGLLAGVLMLRTLQQRDRTMALVLGAVALLNVFETTFFNGALIYPLAAVLGWRAVGRRKVAQAQTGYGSAGAVRFALAMGDAIAATLGMTVGLMWSAQTLGLSFALTQVTPPFVYVTLLWPGIALVMGLYPGYGQPFHRELQLHVRASALASVLLPAVLFLMPAPQPFTPVGFVVSGVFVVVFAVALRQITKRLLRSARLWGRPVVILGTDATAEAVTRHLLDNPDVGLTPMCAYGDTPWQLTQVPVSGSLDAALRNWRSIPVAQAIVSPQAGAITRYDDLLKRGGVGARYIQFIPNLHGLPASGVAVTPLGTTMGLVVRNELASPLNRAVKRALDIALVTLGGFVALPVLALVAALVRLESRGPVLYRHTRIGRDGRAIQVWKFRSMVMDADMRLTQLLAESPTARAEWEANHKLTDDPRVTRIGRVLRETSLDELPQLWNVLVGEMSLVGPRPIVAAEVAKYGEHFALYTQVRPGITGYWQVSGRSDTSYQYRVELDAFYVRNWSVWLDVEVMWRTFSVVLRRDGAH